MNYKFQAQYFAVTDQSVVLLRNRFAYREIKPAEITQVELTKGTDVKRPMISIIFGGALIAISVYLITNLSGFRPSEMSGRGAANSVGYLIVTELFFLGLGGYSIYRALPSHSVIKFAFGWCCHQL